jgi:hypothetical protein
MALGPETFSSLGSGVSDIFAGFAAIRRASSRVKPQTPSDGTKQRILYFVGRRSLTLKKVAAAVARRVDHRRAPL